LFREKLPPRGLGGFYFMNVLIIEDEPLAAERVEMLLKKHDPDFQILAVLDSVEETLKWFAENPAPDLMMVDIHLSDGQSFEIFRQIQVKSPVIFTTAYDQYAIQAFKVNSVDYLLKPVSMAELTVALEKLRHFTALPAVDFQELAASIRNMTRSYKTRFLVKFGDHIQFKTLEEIAYFYADDKIVYLVSAENRRYIVDYRLEELEELLDPNIFYRLNRKFIIKLDAVKNIKTALNSRLQVFLKPHIDTDIYVSREKAQDFKAWLDK
jgi:two-component system, LytTR family, response regulator LytT